MRSAGSRLPTEPYAGHGECPVSGKRVHAVEAVEDVARTLPEDDERRAKLLVVSDSALP